MEALEDKLDAGDLGFFDQFAQTHQTLQKKLIIFDIRVIFHEDEDSVLYLKFISDALCVLSSS